MLAAGIASDWFTSSQAAYARQFSFFLPRVSLSVLLLPLPMQTGAGLFFLISGPAYVGSCSVNVQVGLVSTHLGTDKLPRTVQLPSILPSSVNAEPRRRHARHLLQRDKYRKDCRCLLLFLLSYCPLPPLRRIELQCKSTQVASCQVHGKKYRGERELR